MSQLKQSTREKVLKRDGNQCRFCEITEEEHRDKHDKGLSVHHIIPRRAGGGDDVDNLMAVCTTCHRTIESTQGEAIKKIEQGYTDRNALEEKIANLRSDNDELSRKLHEQQEETQNILKGVDQLLNGRVNVKVYTVVDIDSGLEPRIKYLGTNLEHAQEVFEEASDSRVLKGRRVSTGDICEADISESVLRCVLEKSERLTDRLIEDHGMTDIREEKE